MPNVKDLVKKLDAYIKERKEVVEKFAKDIIAEGDVPAGLIGKRMISSFLDSLRDIKNKKRLQKLIDLIESYISTGETPSLKKKKKREGPPPLKDIWDEFRLALGKPVERRPEPLFKIFPTLREHKTVKEIIDYFKIPERQLELVMVQPMHTLPGQDGAAHDNIIFVNNALDMESAKIVIVHEFTHVAQFLSQIASSIYTPEIVDIIIKSHPDVSNYMNKAELQAFIKQVDYMRTLGYSYDSIKKKIREPGPGSIALPPGTITEGVISDEMIEKIVDKIEETRKEIFSSLKFGKEEPIITIGNFTFTKHDKIVRIEWKGRHIATPELRGSFETFVDNFIKTEIDKYVFGAMSKGWSREKVIMMLGRLIGDDSYNEYILEAVSKRIPSKEVVVIEDGPFKSVLKPYFREPHKIWDFEYTFSAFGSVGETTSLSLVQVVWLTKKPLPYHEIVKDPNIILEDLHKQNILDDVFEKFRQPLGYAPSVEKVKARVQEIDPLIEMSKYSNEIKEQFHKIVQDYISKTYFRPSITPEEKEYEKREELERFFKNQE